MLSIEEFNAAASAYNRRMVIVGAVSVTGVFAWLGIDYLVRIVLGNFLRASLGPLFAEAFFGLFPVAAVPMFLTGMWLGDRRGRRDQRLLCPHCGFMLVPNRRLVVATRNCGQCGKRILAEPS